MMKPMEPNGDKRGRKPTPDAIKRKILELRALRWGIREIAKAVGVSVGTVHKVLKETT